MVSGEGEGCEEGLHAFLQKKKLYAEKIKFVAYFCILLLLLDLVIIYLQNYKISIAYCQHLHHALPNYWFWSIILFQLLEQL